MVTVQINDDWQSRGTMLALQRGCRKREHDIRNQKHSREPDSVVDHRGTYGELGFGIHYGLDMDHVTALHLCGDGGFDYEWNGLLIDVKTRRFGGHYMLIDWDHYLPQPKADIYVCAEPITDIPGEPCIRYLGWVTRREFKDRCVLKQFDDGSAFAVHDDYLNPMAELEAYVMGAITI